MLKSKHRLPCQTKQDVDVHTAGPTEAGLKPEEEAEAKAEEEAEGEGEKHAHVFLATAVETQSKHC